METEQFNIRVPKDLLNDLDFISDMLKVNKSDWVKTRLAENVHEEKDKLLMRLSTQYAQGMISKKEVEVLVGKDIADEMEFIKKKSQESSQKGAIYGKSIKKEKSHS